MASDMKLPVTAQQPVECELNVLTKSGHEQILNLISATHLSADDNFDVDSLFVDVKKIFKRTFAILDKLLWGWENTENQEEKVSRANFDPLFCTLEELSSEMACKTPGVEIAHKTTMSILNKLPSYSWVAKAVLTLAASALVYEDFLALAQLHSSIQRVESMEIPEHAPAALTLLNLQKYKETIHKLNSTIHGLMNFVTKHICELNKLCNNYMKDEPSLLSYVVDDIPVAVYWTIINVVACTTHMCCLSSYEDKTQELLPLAGKECDIRYHLGSCINNCNERIEKAQTRKMKELLQTPDESMEVFKALIFAKDDMQPLIDGSTNEMVSINVLENKYVLLFISSLEISNDDISILKRTHDFRGNWEDNYKIVWIPIVEQWSDGLRKKFEMLRSKMPWYVVQYFSPVARIKFIKEEWHFEYKPIVVVINPQGNVINDNAIDMIRLYGTFKRRVYPTGSNVVHMVDPTPLVHMAAPTPLVHMVDPMPCILICRPAGPYAIEEYTFLCGGKDNEWIKQFSEKVNVVAEDPITKESNISIELFRNGEGRRKQWHFWKLRKTRKMPNSDPGSQEIQKLLLSLKNESRWAVLTKSSTRVVSHQGSTILKVLEAFEEWKVNVPEKGFEICFNEFHDKFLQTGSLPLTPSPVEGS